MYSKKITFRKALLALLVSSQLAAQVSQRLHPGGIITGRVETEAGRPLAGVDIVVVRIPVPDILRTGPPVASTRTVEGGTFQISGLPQGSFRLCPQMTSSEYLDPCEWSTSNTVVSIGPNGVKRGVVVRMETGYLITVRVDDPEEMLDKNLGKLKGSNLVVGYQHRTKPFALKAPSNVTKKGREYSFAIPFESAEFRIGVQSMRFALEDAGNRALAAMHEIPVPAARKGSPPAATVVLRVKGVN